MATHRPLVGNLYCRFFCCNLVGKEGDPLQDVQGLKTGDHARGPVFCNQVAVGLSADHHRDMAGADEAVDADLRVVEQGCQGGHHYLVGGDDGEVVDLLCLGGEEGRRHRRGGGFKAHPEEDHFPVGVLSGQIESVQGE